MSVTNPITLSGSWSSDHWDTAPCILANHILVPWSRLLFHSCSGVMPKWIIIITVLSDLSQCLDISGVYPLKIKLLSGNMYLIESMWTTVAVLRERTISWKRLWDEMRWMRWMHVKLQYTFQVCVTEQQSLSALWDLRGMARGGCCRGRLSRG